MFYIAYVGGVFLSICITRVTKLGTEFSGIPILYRTAISHQEAAPFSTEAGGQVYYHPTKYYFWCPVFFCKINGTQILMVF